MAEVVLSSAVRSNLLALQNTADLLAKTQERLATGRKVNSALDDPTAFFTASSLENRASDFNRLLDSVGLAVNTLEAADNAISAITDLVESAQSLANQARESSSTTASVTGTVSGISLTDTLDTLGFADGQTFTVQSGTATATTYTAATAATATVQDLIDGLNADANINVTLVNGSIVIEEATGANLTIGGTATLSGTGFTAGTTTGTANTVRSGLATQFDAIRTQIDQLAADAGFNGNNLLQSDNLTVTFNEAGTSSLTITGVNFNAAGLSINASTESFQTTSSIDVALSELTAAIGTLRSQASSFGSNLSVVETRQNFTENLINVLESGAANLTLADTNQEGANLLALQTRQQLSSTALSLASQADQNVLRLF